MTAAQKKVAANFKKALAYRKQTGCSLKEAFAKVYGKKTTSTKKAGPKKSPTKKKSIGGTKVAADLGERLWDKKSDRFRNQFELHITSLMEESKNYLNYTYPQCKTAIRFIVDEIMEFNSENY
jgi:hypothetical protein